jgi:two-component system CheB/CheR fusion protein
VVDDHAEQAAMLAICLRFEGHVAWTAADELSAVETARSLHPDVVLCGIALPSLDGYRVARQICRLPGGGRITLVAMTGYRESEAGNRPAAAGFDQYLAKPVDPAIIEELLRTVAR